MSTRNALPDLSSVSPTTAAEVFSRFVPIFWVLVCLLATRCVALQGGSIFDFVELFVLARPLVTDNDPTRVTEQRPDGQLIPR